nr:ATP-binding cassette domain-containing protein [Vibrio parahaemolyticus]
MNLKLDNQQTDDAVVVTGLKMGYGDKILLENASFNVKCGEILVILGGSGCGKSSLMKHIIGLYAPISGDIYINGKSIVHAGESEKASIQRELGVMYQSGALFGSLNILENVRFPLDEFTDLGLMEKTKFLEHYWSYWKWGTPPS